LFAKNFLLNHGLFEKVWLAKHTNEKGSYIKMESKFSKDVDRILESYSAQIQNLNAPYSSEAVGMKEAEKRLREETVSELKSKGYSAFDVNASTFSDAEASLQTKFNSIGLTPDYSYIVFVSGDEESEDISDEKRASAGSSFTHTYNGTTYTMRYLTVTADDDPLYGKASKVNLLQTASQTLIQNCLDTLINAYISSISSLLGTVASICGLSISNFSTAQTSILDLKGGTNWTRVYTQVWDASRQTWQYAACVENVRASSSMDGLYYRHL
jgi:hypothetical protein